MKRITLLLGTLFSVFSIMTAQPGDTLGTNAGFFSQWDYGAKAGINLSNMYGDVGNNSYIFSFHAGMVAKRPFNENLGLLVEPHLSIEGQRLNGGFDRITFLNIPALVSFNISEQFSVDGGLKLAIKIIEKTKFGTTGNTQRRNRFKTLHPGIVAGSTYAINENWFTQFRINVKLPDVVRKSGGDSEGSIILLFQFSAGYMFGG